MSEASAASHGRTGDWVAPTAEAHGLPRYLEMLRAGRWLLVAVFVVTVGAAGLYLARAEKVYEAESDLLVTPFPRDAPVPLPGVIRESSDPTRDVETVARLIESTAVARRVRDRLKLPHSTKFVLRKIEAEPVAQSNIVTITAQDDTPSGAKRLADTYGSELVASRKEDLERTVNSQLARLRIVQRAASPEGRATVSAQIAFLETLAGGPDPTVRVQAEAEEPNSPISPRPVLTIAAAVIGGLILGLIAVFALFLIDPRLRREQQLRQRFRLPILARIPMERRHGGNPLLPQQVSTAAHDAYQTLRAALSGGRADSVDGRIVLVTGPSPGDGKTTAAINLASTLASAGKRVILIEADSRRPSIGRALGIKPEQGLAGVVAGRTYLVDALIPVGGEDSTLRVVLNAEDELAPPDMLSSLSADTLLLQARRLADWVIVDSPPLNHVAETMAIARAVDHVLIVVRIGKSNLRDLDELAEMLAQQNITPGGFVVFGGQARTAYY